jgi:hypothetical protein
MNAGRQVVVNVGFAGGKLLDFDPDKYIRSICANNNQREVGK